MRRFHTGLTLIIGLALTLCLTGWWKTRRELRAVTASNELLRETLGDLTIAIAQKEREIDRLEQSPCGTQEKARPSSRKWADPGRRIDSTGASGIGQIAAK